MKSWLEVPPLLSWFWTGRGRRKGHGFKSVQPFDPGLLQKTLLFLSKTSEVAVKLREQREMGAFICTAGLGLN